MTATITVLTYKAGVLSRVAHDLKFQLKVDVQGRELHIDPRDLRLVCAMKGGGERPVSAKDRRSIEQHLQQDVLESGRFPEIVFRAQRALEQPLSRVSGELELHGVRRPVTLNFRAGTARLTLHQPDYGVRPFSAMMGSLKIKPGVDLVIHLGPGRN